MMYFHTITALMCIIFLSSVHAEQVSMQFSFSPEQLFLKNTPEGTCVGLDGCVQPETTAGTPWLPVKYINLQIPAGSRVIGSSFAAQEISVQEGITVRPAQPQHPLSLPRPAAAPKDAATYAMNVKYPVSAGEITGTHTMRGFTFASAALHPVRYIPSEQKLFLATNITVTITVDTPDRTPVAAYRNTKIFERYVSQLVENKECIAEYMPVVEQATMETADDTDYLVITAAALTGAFQSLADHRISRELSAAVVSVESIIASYSGTDTQEKIRNCIKEYVATHGTLYVVLGGDDTIIPDRDCDVFIGYYKAPDMPTDLYYSGLDGNWDDWNGNGIYGEADVDGINAQDEGDLAPDVIVGRIPVRTSSEAMKYINKVIAYETGLLPRDYVSKIFLGGVRLWDSYYGPDRPADPVIDGHPGFREHASVSDAEMWERRFYREGVYPFWQADTIGLFFDTLSSWDTSTGGDYELNPANMAQRLNEGWHFMSFDTHGWSSGWSMESGGFTSSDALSLVNTVDVIYTMACTTGKFDGEPDPCLSEGFIRNGNGGALAYIGSSRYGWGGPDDPPASPVSDGGTSSAYEYEFYRQLFQERKTIVGEAFALHKVAKASACGANYAYRWIQFGLNLQGDPALEIKPWYGVHYAGHSITNLTAGRQALQPGETAAMRISLNNAFTNQAVVTATLVSTGSNFTVTAPTSQDYSFQPGETVSNSSLYTLSVSSGCPDGSHPCFLVISNATFIATNILFVSVERQPSLECTPAQVTMVSYEGEPAETTLLITNKGTGILSYMVCGSNDYTFMTSDMAGGPVYEWIDISSSGTLVPIGDDDVSMMIPIGFDFYFYGRKYTSFEIGGNGGLGLEPGYLDGNNQPLPCLPHNGPGPFIAPFWDDFDPGVGGEIRYFSDGTKLVVSFIDVPRLLSTSDLVTFQVVLYNTGRILYQYKTINGPVYECTVGIQEANIPARCLQVCYNEPFIKNNFAIEIFIPDFPMWLSLSPVIGTVDSYQSTGINLTSAGLDHPTNGIIHVWHNDISENCLTEIPITIIIPEPIWPTAIIGLLLLVNYKERRH
jgi:hypothetical protein